MGLPCNICLHWGGLGVNVGIYSRHGMYGNDNSLQTLTALFSKCCAIPAKEPAVAGQWHTTHIQRKCFEHIPATTSFAAILLQALQGSCDTPNGYVCPHGKVARLAPSFSFAGMAASTVINIHLLGRWMMMGPGCRPFSAFPVMLIVRT